MNNFCLPKEITQGFLRGLKSGEINPATLTDMSTAERNAFFEKYVGTHAKDVNTLFESKLLLKNQQQGMITWAKTVGSMKPAEYKTLVEKIRSLDTVLSPENERAFLEDIASKKLGTEVSFDEAKKIVGLSKEIEGLKQNVTTDIDSFIAGKETQEQFAKRIQYGAKVLEMHDYVETLNPIRKGLIANVMNLPKTMMSTLDLSAPLRQGWGMLGRPKQFLPAFRDMFKYAFSKKAFEQMQADLISRPTYALMQKGQLRVSSLATRLSQREEQFMSNILSKVPGLAGSERAYTGFLNKLRADVFDDLIRKAQLAGEDVSVQSKVIKDIASVVNDFTGSGHIGAGDKYANTVPVLNATFFSPRKISATVNMFNPERYLNPAISKTARKAALRQLIGSIGATGSIIGLATMAGGESTLDPRSSDFGKIVVGNTHFDVTGGNGNFAVLIARLIANSSVSTTTGKTTEFGEGYKPSTRLSTVGKFARNKLSPMASLIVSSMAGTDSMGNPVELPKEIINRMMPLIVSDTYELIKEDPAGAIPTTLVSMFGVGVNRY